MQRTRLRELRQYAKEYRAARCSKQLDELDSLEHFYRDRFDLLAESLQRERHELEMRERDERRVTGAQQRKLRHSMEKEVRELQQATVDRESDMFYRELDADRCDVVVFGLGRYSTCTLDSVGMVLTVIHAGRCMMGLECMNKARHLLVPVL